MKKFDVVVVGAGTGGCATATALAQKGINVALLDRKKKEKIGDKICGDATSHSYFDHMANEGCKIDKPSGEEILQTIGGAYIGSPNNKAFLPIEREGAGWILERHVFGQRLLHNAEDAGAILLPESHALDIIMKAEQPQGVIIRKQGKAKEELSCKVIVDCSGVSTALRRRVIDYSKEDLGFEKVIDDRDMVYGYREIRNLAVPLDHPHMMLIYFDQTVSPGGYFWVFPRGTHSANVGLGVDCTYKEHSPRDLFNKRIKDDPLFKDSEVIHKGAARIPLRRPLDSLVANGYLLVGDAGCQVKATDGGGIGASLWGGAMAANAVEKCVESDSFTRKDLWIYNVDFMRNLGRSHGKMEILKHFITRLTNKQINTILCNKVIEGNDLLDLQGGEIPWGKTETLRRLWRGKGVISLLAKLPDIKKRIEIADKLYEEYPETPEMFPAWKKEILSVFNR
ncbi:MAG: geranylgeranyl reductase family protein [Candidatus Hermodarchaeota archaeon]